MNYALNAFLLADLILPNIIVIAPPPAQIPIDATIWVTNPNCQDGSHEIHFTLKSSQRISIILSNNESNVSHPCEFILDLRRPHSIDLFDCAGPEIRGKTLLAFNVSAIY